MTKNPPLSLLACVEDFFNILAPDPAQMPSHQLALHLERKRPLFHCSLFLRNNQCPAKQCEHFGGPSCIVL
jgi:hypothetical protein